MSENSIHRRQNVLLLIAAVAAIGALICSHLGGAIFPTLRWIALVALIVYGCLRRTLTAWIFIAMLLGAEIGHDWPHVAEHLRVLALIFLRSIKAIIAPLVFATLVVGIAGHSNLRQVGRLGLRSIIFFEVVTTIAIFLGLGAINLSKAGVGVQLTATTAADTGSVSKLSAEDTILHVFPENIAKAVADGAVLQVVVFSLIFAVALAMLSEQKRRPMLNFCE
ncbi:MAG: cation:dicarboxylase symporter family transporter, partial [Candidatus Korobacteraceae bacterium]